MTEIWNNNNSLFIHHIHSISYKYRVKYILGTKVTEWPSLKLNCSSYNQDLWWISLRFIDLMWFFLLLWGPVLHLWVLENLWLLRDEPDFSWPDVCCCWWSQKVKSLISGISCYFKNVKVRKSYLLSVSGSCRNTVDQCCRPSYSTCYLYL